MAGVIGVSVYIYQDPDVLPEPIRKFLPIKGVEGKNMTLEEYEVWRASQSLQAFRNEKARIKKQLKALSV
ncbi:hypothetical protein DYB25_008666 [Aphanomyces astaci]|nr:hypothetical protein DYB25_008666 [Aphanomyces astaci]RHY41435.1 hypothetical protein DYB30_009216 [Aphanomyces astaci]RHZ38566.1 hypothetical protein DYB31_008187 [Aphanomyces astaci]